MGKIETKKNHNSLNHDVMVYLLEADITITSSRSKCLLLTETTTPSPVIVGSANSKMVGEKHSREATVSPVSVC